MDYLFFLWAYLIGSIPSSVWIGKRFYNVDVREHGSGNAGATNSFRILGKRVGSIVLIIDIFKAWFSTYVLSYMANDQSTENMLGLGMVAVLGHIFPIYIGFRGGKGIASLLGVIIAIQPTAALFSIITFLTSLIFSRYVSLSSILAACTFPATIILYLKSDNNALIIFSVMVSVLVLFTHKKNIERLFKKEESRVNLPRRIFKRKLKRKRN